MEITIDKQNLSPRIKKTGTLVYSELTNALFIKSKNKGVMQIGSSVDTSNFVEKSTTIDINGVAQDLSTNRTWTIFVPTKTSELTNDSGFLTSSDLSGYVDTSNPQTVAGLKTFTSHIYYSPSAGIGFRAGKAPTNNNNDSNIWLGANAVNPGYQNSTVSQGSNYTIFNSAIANSTIYFGINNSYYMNIRTGGIFVGSGLTAANASAIFEISSTTKGVLIPRMTSTQASAITSPAEGLLLYVTNTNATFTSKGWWGYNGSAWEKLNN